MGRDSSSTREHKQNNAHPRSNWGVTPQPQRVRAINPTLPRSQQHQGDECDRASVLFPQREISCENQQDVESCFGSLTSCSASLPLPDRLCQPPFSLLSSCPRRSNAPIEPGFCSRVCLPYLRAGWGEEVCLHRGKTSGEPRKCPAAEITVSVPILCEELACRCCHWHGQRNWYGGLHHP